MGPAHVGRLDIDRDWVTEWGWASGGSAMTVDGDSLGIDPAFVEAAATGRTRAILPVHVFGRPCGIGRSYRPRAREVSVIEDACEAIASSIGAGLWRATATSWCSRLIRTHSSRPARTAWSSSTIRPLDATARSEDRVHDRRSSRPSHARITDRGSCAPVPPSGRRCRSSDRAGRDHRRLPERCPRVGDVSCDG